jgi:phage terminase small subunit
MGQRGPAPEPARLKLLKGETRPSQHAKAPQPTDPPSKPDGLTPAAGRVWDQTLAAIAGTAHIGPAHANTFRQFCETAATLNAMRPKGSKEWRELVLVNLRLARELCLTPATGTALARAIPPERKLDRYVKRTG